MTHVGFKLGLTVKGKGLGPHMEFCCETGAHIRAHGGSRRAGPADGDYTPGTASGQLHAVPGRRGTAGGPHRRRAFHFGCALRRSRSPGDF